LKPADLEISRETKNTSRVRGTRETMANNRKKIGEKKMKEIAGSSRKQG